MTSRERCEIEKDSIYQLYVNEGRSIRYISQLFNVNRKVLSDHIRLWDFKQKNQFRGVKPSNQKYINNHREKILGLMRKDIGMSEMARKLGVDRNYLRQTVIQNDKTLYTEYLAYKQRINLKNDGKKTSKKDEYKDLDGELWVPVKGFSKYDISNKGRVRSLYCGYYKILNNYPNIKNGYLYTNLVEDGKRKMVSVARLVGHAFLEDTYTEETNTINHKDGDKNNNCVENLEWVSQQENNQHSFEIHPDRKIKNRLIFDKIIYNEKYEFKTIKAYAKFINISPTQARRRLENPEKWGLEIVTTRRNP